MSVENEIKIMKEKYLDFVVFVKIGAFYHAYYNDAYIISYLCGYQLKRTPNLNDCGFPASIIEEVLKKMESQKINYVVVNKDFDIEGQKNFGKMNKYNEVFDGAYRYLLKRCKIDEINRYLLQNIYTDNILKEINEIEKIIYKI